jgi:hypothetical protein
LLARRALDAGRTLFTGGTLFARRTRGTLRSLFALEARRALFTRGTLDARRAWLTGETFGPREADRANGHDEPPAALAGVLLALGGVAVIARRDDQRVVTGHQPGRVLRHDLRAARVHRDVLEQARIAGTQRRGRRRAAKLSDVEWPTILT